MHAHRRRNAFRSRTRAWIALAAVLYLAGLIAAGLHHQRVRHQVCEHGEVVHASAGADLGCAVAGARGGVAVDARHAQADSTAPGDGGGHEHEHCSIAVPLSIAARAERSLVAAALPAACNPACAYQVERALSPLSVLSRAPHHSPPL